MTLIQDEDFVVDKDDGGSPTDDSGEEDADAIDSGDEKEVRPFSFESSLYAHAHLSLIYPISTQFAETW